MSSADNVATIVSNVSVDVPSKETKPRKPRTKKVATDDATKIKDGGIKKKRAPKDLKDPKDPKKVKDPNAPKKRPSAFIMFSTELRKKLKETNPTLAFADASKEVGKQWKELSEVDRNVYIQKAAYTA